MRRKMMLMINNGDADNSHCYQGAGSARSFSLLPLANKSTHRETRSWNIFCMRLKNWWTQSATEYVLLASSVEKCCYLLWKAPKLQLNPTSYHTIPIALSPWPSSSLFLLPVLYFLISAPLPLHLLSLSSFWSHCPPTCLPVLVQPPLSASVNVFCPYKERAQADCTNRVSSAGVLQGQGDHSDCNGRVRWEEDGGEWMEGWGVGRGVVSSYHTSVNDSK